MNSGVRGAYLLRVLPWLAVLGSDLRCQESSGGGKGAGAHCRGVLGTALAVAAARVSPHAERADKKNKSTLVPNFAEASLRKGELRGLKAVKGKERKGALCLPVKIVQYQVRAMAGVAVMGRSQPFTLAVGEADRVPGLGLRCITKVRLRCRRPCRARRSR
eukprot:COSAG04_NODE_203_length_20431_cov_12.598269_13_plen_161_part_00